MDENAVKLLIANELALSLAPGGAMAQAILNVKETGDKALTGVTELNDRVTALDKIEKELDAEFPFRVFERECGDTVWALGWKKLMVDRDHLANLADQMGDPSVAQTMALWAQHKDDPHITQLKDAVSFKNAPKTKWKELCLESHGGSPDKYRASCWIRAQIQIVWWRALLANVWPSTRSWKSASRTCSQWKSRPLPRSRSRGFNS
jgi:hypothetical protein